MRAAFLSLATLALTAFAVPTAPAVNTNQLNELRSAEVASSEALHTFTKHAVKTKVKGNAELILVLQNRLDNIKHSTSSISKYPLATSIKNHNTLISVHHYRLNHGPGQSRHSQQG